MATTYNRRSFINLLGGGALAACHPALSLADEAKTNKYNVLFIAVDDLRPELGCYGVDYALSPHIDRFAQSAVRFTNHFVQVPTCGASRFSLLTGRAPAQSGVTGGNHAFYRGDTALSHEKLDAAQSMPELFRRSGYRTINIGKISHTADGKVYAYNGKGDGRDEVPHAWDELATPYGPWKRGWGVFFAYANGKHREDGQGHKDLKEFIAEKDEDLPDGLNAKVAIEKLRECKNDSKPFFMGLGFYKPHLPFVATQKDWDAMQDVDVPLAPHQEKPETAYWHRSGEFYKYDMPYAKTYPLADEAQRNARRAYLACVRYTDRQVGKVLNALDELGLSENTIVVLWGDHGWQLGDSQLWAKHTPFERAVHSPMMIRVPGMKQAGKASSALVETVDIYPTLMQLCNPKFQNTQHPLSGKNLVPLLDDPRRDVRKAALSYWKDAVSIRTKTHRLIAEKKGNEYKNIELYNIQQSPDPIKNLAASNKELVKTLLNYMPG
ncbi:sulfatase-like hydrolase/transferase [bacterium]|nr:sulfatase-like hydrolase/transferase [bacterium]